MRRPSIDLTDPANNFEESDAPSSKETTKMDLDLTMPPSEEDVAEQDRRIYTPPPRVAARFYRPSHARRKESAASSRRNSISSAHSRCSSIQMPSQLDGVQSKQVAQHLRRASFLEDRRARLADRAAHAEKVRLRAALAKAVPRGSSASEERALAAQQARERNLAEIVANCAEEVRKAKQVAEFMREKREQELSKMKAQQAERMAEAERRREEFRSKSAIRRNRGQSDTARRSIEVPATEPAPSPRLSEADAATRLQSFWRASQRRRTAEAFNDIGLTVDGISQTSFDNVVELLGEDKVLIVTARLLRICGLDEGEPGSVEEMAAVRTFLSAYMILGHPNQVLINKNNEELKDDSNDVTAGHRLPSTDLDNPQLQDLVGKAKDLLICFENILSRLSNANRHTMPPALKGVLAESYAVFYNAFIAWKSRDSNALIEVMLLQFVELDAILQDVKNTTDDAAAAVYRQSIVDNQLMLIVRIKKLAGPEKGKKMIFSAVTEARKARKLLEKKAKDTTPRIADDAEGGAAASSSKVGSSEAQTPTPPATPSSSNRPQSSPGHIGLNSLLPDNRIVIHELAINDEYQIPSDEYKEQQALLTEPLYVQMRMTMNDVDNANNFHFFTMVAANIKNKLQRLLKPDTSLYNLIGEILDPEMAHRQFALGNFSYEKFFAAMASLLPKLCAPFRDDEVKDLIRNKMSEGNLIDRVQALNGFIDVMLCDYINYLLRVAAPQLIETAAQYEAKRFTSDVEKDGMSLSAAEAAWRSARAKVMAEVQKRDPEGINHPKAKPSAARFYAQMMVDIFTQPRPVKRNAVPEMLRLDMGRIDQVSMTVQKIITVGAILLQCKNLLKRDVRSPWKTEASRIMTVLEADTTSIDSAVDGVMAALQAGRSMPGATKNHLRALTRKILAASQDMALNSAEPRDPVLRLLLTRLRGNILARLSAGSASEKVKVAHTAGEKLASLGLSEFVEKVRHISDLLDKIGSVDKAAHEPWWNAIATKIEQEESLSASA
ncbi:hypothetical protein S40285_01741 [Stachybotrys chlorohalonatus IBT 40285]|uniref:T-complex protein 11-like protein 1 n=1 Tax=Stachybotrys chlorohalonatus (strain IBT 40285) TaxID=1283841 RepID=A0A084R2A7_STAC4|nr:hypothetical protein S40285_01741 [Stachybotrys chlorohalonata IBT 40285]